MAFMFMAFLMGGLTINANAQQKPKGSSETVTPEEQAKINEIKQWISDYKSNVNSYISSYQIALKYSESPAGRKGLKKGTTDRPKRYVAYRKEAKRLEAKILENRNYRSKIKDWNDFEETRKKFDAALKQEKPLKFN